MVLVILYQCAYNKARSLGGVLMLARCVVSVAIFACGSLQAGPCVFGTLASYEALGSTGCTVGEFTANNFVFSLLGSAGGAVPVTDTQIFVQPTLSGPGLIGLNFSSAGFSVVASGSVQYLIGYTFDPLDDIRSMDDVMDPPSAVLGFANITTTGCLNAAFVGSTCPTTTATVMVFDNNGATQFKNSVFFAGVPVLGIRNIIDLQAKGGSASFDSLTAESFVPEPATWLTCAGALLLLAARSRTVYSRLHS
jgi:hypothetical protein